MAVCLTTIASFAQKLGHINGQNLVEHMPEYAAAYDSLKTFKEQFEAELVRLQGDYEKMVAEYQKAAKEKTLPASILEAKVGAIEAQQQNIYAFQETASAEVSKEEQKKVEPILTKAKAAIEKVAKANGYTYIFDAGVGTLLYMGGDDITKLTCAELGIPDYTVEKPMTPGGGPKK